MTRLSISTIFFSAVILLAMTDANAGLDEGLVFYFNFDNVKDQTIGDTSGNGLDAEIIENTKIVKGKYGDAIHITNNGQDCVNIPSDEKLKVVGEITMTAWIHYQETWKGKKVHWIDKGCHWFGVDWGASYGIGSIDIGAGPGIWLFLGARDNRGISDRQEFIVPHEMEEKRWHHVAGSYDRKTMKIYLDGEIMGEDKREFNFAGDNIANVWIGCAKNKYAFVNGSIDEAAVWQRALNGTEIKQAMSGSFLAVSPNGKIATAWANLKTMSVYP
ncbi:MAG: LamG domain-containing protein [Candidatus Poribacteria bacterium]|nr:LamG domain-containing protein [Candidatus Poribacteria bacterium]